MKIIENKEFEGERPLYMEKNLILKKVIVHAGESALKETENIVAEDCRFEGKYPFWCCNGFSIKNCLFTGGARAALWYSSNLDMQDTIVDAPKMFREMDGIKLKNVMIPCAGETLWSCRNIEMDNVVADRADYIFMHCKGAKINNFKLDGNYSFQWTSDVEIRNSILNTKDAFWETDNVSVYDSTIKGEFLGWHSRNLKLVRCHIGGSQPLCYCENLILEDCTFDADADLAFEHSSVTAIIKGHIHSIKNPKSGSIKVNSVGELIMDSQCKAPANCNIEVID